MRVERFKEHNEKLNIKEMDANNKSIFKYNIINKLEEYRDSLFYGNLSELDVKTILRELNNQFSEQYVNHLNIEGFLKRINNMLSENDKENINRTFNSFIKRLEKRY